MHHIQNNEKLLLTNRIILLYSNENLLKSIMPPKSKRK